ncbi:IS66 family insertion sequence element accessory protein TnpB [Bradyrhizobium sp.]
MAPPSQEFRGRNGKLIKSLWHDGLGMSLYAKRLERGLLPG